MEMANVLYSHPTFIFYSHASFLGFGSIITAAHLSQIQSIHVNANADATPPPREWSPEYLSPDIIRRTRSCLNSAIRYPLCGPNMLMETCAAVQKLPALRRLKVTLSAASYEHIFSERYERINAWKEVKEIWQPVIDIARTGLDIEVSVDWPRLVIPRGRGEVPFRMTRRTGVTPMFNALNSAAREAFDN
jgi:hypothetical protein